MRRKRIDITVNQHLNELNDYSMVVLSAEVTADATAGLSIPVPFPMVVDLVNVNCKFTVSGGTIQLKNGSTAITDAIACATSGASGRNATLDDTVVTLNKSTVLKAFAANATTRGRITVIGHRV